MGNYIGIHEQAEVMFKKVMEVPDALIIKYFELATDEHPDTIEQIKAELAGGVNPKDVKYRLAKIITSLYHMPEDVQKAMIYYEMAFSQKAIPNEIPELSVAPGNTTIAEIIMQLVGRHLVPSKSEFARLVRQGGVQLNGEKLTIDDLKRLIQEKDVLRIGKKRFVKFIK